MYQTKCQIFHVTKTFYFSFPNSSGLVRKREEDVFQEGESFFNENFKTR